MEADDLMQHLPKFITMEQKKQHNRSLKHIEICRDLQAITRYSKAHATRQGDPGPAGVGQACM